VADVRPVDLVVREPPRDPPPRAAVLFAAALRAGGRDFVDEAGTR
jgi:hypothetical protein